MIVKLLTEHHLEFLSLKGGCRGSSESNCWKSHANAQLFNLISSKLPLSSQKNKKNDKMYLKKKIIC